MHKILYGLATGAIVLLMSALFFGVLPELGLLLRVPEEHLLAYTLILVGVTVLYFSYFRPHWFSKELIPSAGVTTRRLQAAALRKRKTVVQKPSFANESDFWKLLPFGLFFTLGGIVYLIQPNFSSLIVVMICSAWLSVLYRLV